MYHSKSDREMKIKMENLTSILDYAQHSQEQRKAASGDK
jgi:hypothetical protein